MKKIKSFVFIVFMVFITLDVFANDCPGEDRFSCAGWDEMNNHITPLPVIDVGTLSAGLIPTEIEQASEFYEAVNQEIEKVQKFEKWASSVLGLSGKSVDSLSVPKLASPEKGSETAVAAFKGEFAGFNLGNLDFAAQDDQVSDAVTQVAVVSDPKTGAERQADWQRANAFIQQSIIDLLARVLFYKSELAQLSETGSEMGSTDSSSDSVGSHNVNVSLRDTELRIMALEEKILATRIELEGILILKNALKLRNSVGMKG